MNAVSKTFTSIVVLVVGLIPLWIWLAIRALLSPEGFWQEFFLLGVGVWLLGIIQLVFLFVALLFIIAVYED